MEKDADLDHLAIRLFDAGIIRINTRKGFVGLKHHREKTKVVPSPIYFDFSAFGEKKDAMFAELLEDIGYFMWRRMNFQQADFLAVAGLPNDGIPIAKSFCNERALPFITLGKSGVGEKRKVDSILDHGGAERGCSVLLIDDVLTAGGTMSEGKILLEGSGYVVKHGLVVINRQQGGEERLLDLEVRLAYLLTMNEVIDVLSDTERISAKVEKKIRAYADMHVC